MFSISWTLGAFEFQRICKFSGQLAKFRFEVWMNIPIVSGHSHQTSPLWTNNFSWNYILVSLSRMLWSYCIHVSNFTYYTNLNSEKTIMFAVQEYSREGLMKWCSISRSRWLITSTRKICLIMLDSVLLDNNGPQNSSEIKLILSSQFRLFILFQQQIQFLGSNF